MSPVIERVSRSIEETMALGERLGGLLRDGDVVLLHGDLGAGKTTLVQGVARALHVDAGARSPTFTLVTELDGVNPDGEPLGIYHLDLYRLDGPEAIVSSGYGDIMVPERGVALVEWPERAAGWLPDAYLLIEFRMGGGNERQLTLRAEPPVGRPAELLAALASALE